MIPYEQLRGAQRRAMVTQININGGHNTGQRLPATSTCKPG